MESNSSIVKAILGVRGLRVTSGGTTIDSNYCHVLKISDISGSSWVELALNYTGNPRAYVRNSANTGWVQL